MQRSRACFINRYTATLHLYRIMNCSRCADYSNMSMVVTCLGGQFKYTDETLSVKERPFRTTGDPLFAGRNRPRALRRCAHALSQHVLFATIQPSTGFATLDQYGRQKITVPAVGLHNLQRCFMLFFRRIQRKAFLQRPPVPQRAPELRTI